MKIYIPTKIDKDNLPKGEVIAINVDGKTVRGKLCLTFSKLDVRCSFNDYTIWNVTHYLREVEIPEDSGEEKYNIVRKSFESGRERIAYDSGFRDGYDTLVSKLK